MSRYINEHGLRWQPTWTQAMTDFRSDDEEQPFADVTVRMTVPASIGGSYVRVELSNRFGDEPVLIGRGAISTGSQSLDIAFIGQRSTKIPARESRWTDPLKLAIHRGDHVAVDLYLPELTPYVTANGFRFQRSATQGDFVGSLEFPSLDTGVGLALDGTGWSLPSGGPFLRAIEVAGTEAKAVFVCLGASITTMGWPQFTVASLPDDSRIAVLNRGIPGNRLLFDAPYGHASWGRSALSRFDEDVLETTGVTHVVLAHASNDICLPGKFAPLSELPSAAQQIDGYRQLIRRAQSDGLEVILATITPMPPEHADAPDREQIRVAVNDWIRTSGLQFVDFEEVIKSDVVASRIAAKYDVGDHQHPNITGQKRLGQAMAKTIARLHL